MRMGRLAGITGVWLTVAGWGGFEPGPGSDRCQLERNPSPGAELVVMVYTSTPCLPARNALVVLTPGGRTSVTDTAGVARLRELAPGPYLLSVRPIGEPRTEFRVDVRRGERQLVTVDLSLAPAAP